LLVHLCYFTACAWIAVAEAIARGLQGRRVYRHLFRSDEFGGRVENLLQAAIICHREVVDFGRC
jgi:hypothetical protein